MEKLLNWNTGSPFKPPFLPDSKHSALPAKSHFSQFPRISPTPTEAALPREPVILGSFSSAKPPYTCDLIHNNPGGHYYYPYFTHKETRAHRGEVTCPSHGAICETKSESGVCALKHLTCFPLRHHWPLAPLCKHSCQGLSCPRPAHWATPPSFTGLRNGKYSSQHLGPRQSPGHPLPQIYIQLVPL